MGCWAYGQYLDGRTTGGKGSWKRCGLGRGQGGAEGQHTAMVCEACDFQRSIGLRWYGAPHFFILGALESTQKQLVTWALYAVCEEIHRPCR